MHFVQPVISAEKKLKSPIDRRSSLLNNISITWELLIGIHQDNKFYSNLHSIFNWSFMLKVKVIQKFRFSKPEQLKELFEITLEPAIIEFFFFFFIKKPILKSGKETNFIKNLKIREMDGWMDGWTD